MEHLQHGKWNLGLGKKNFKERQNSLNLQILEILYHLIKYVS